MKRDLVWLATIVVATAAGYWIGDSDEAPDRRRSQPNRETAISDPREAERSALEAKRPERPTASAAPAAGGRAVWERMVGRPPTDEEWQAIRERAQLNRERLLVAADSTESPAAAMLARELLNEQQRAAEEKLRIEDAKRGGTMALLRGLRGKPMHLSNLVADHEAFAAHFERTTPGPRVDGAGLRPGDGIVDGSQIEFPAGVHQLDTRPLRSMKSFPRDLLVAGVGMDQTLLRIDQDFTTRSEVRSLTFRDLTLDCNNNYLTDLRREHPATIRFERCRVVGFDMGAGGSVMFAANAGALYATDCRFEAGYSRTTAGFGNLFRVRSGLLVRMERCVFLGPFRSIYDRDNAATYHFADCEISDTKQLLAQCKSRPGSGVTFERCVLTELAGNTRKIARSFSDINPDWPKRKR